MASTAVEGVESSKSRERESAPRPEESLALVGGSTLEEACGKPYANSIAFLSFRPNPGDELPVSCTGSVISSKHVLTAAHCGGLKTYSGQGRFYVRCGCGDVVTENSQFSAIVDPDDATYALDAAVITFPELPDNCELMPLADHEQAARPGQSVTIAGFGLQADGPAGSLSDGKAILEEKLEDASRGHGLGPRKRMIAIELPLNITNDNNIGCSCLNGSFKTGVSIP